MDKKELPFNKREQAAFIREWNRSNSYAKAYAAAVGTR